MDLIGLAFAELTTNGSSLLHLSEQTCKPAQRPICHKISLNEQIYCDCIKTNSPMPKAGPSNVATTIIMNGFATITETPATLPNITCWRSKYIDLSTQALRPSTSSLTISIHDMGEFAIKFVKDCGQRFHPLLGATGEDSVKVIDH